MSRTKLIQEIKALRKQGLTYKDIATHFNDRGITTLTGKQWSYGSVNSLDKWKRSPKSKKQTRKTTRSKVLSIELIEEVITNPLFSDDLKLAIIREVIA